MGRIRRLGSKPQKRPCQNRPSTKDTNPLQNCRWTRRRLRIPYAMRFHLSFVLTSAVCLLALMNLSGAEPIPQTQQKPVTDEYQGVKVEDNYQWLEQED